MMLVVAEAVLVFELLILFMLLMVVLKFNSLDELFILAEKKRAKQKEKEREKKTEILIMTAAYQEIYVKNLFKKNPYLFFFTSLYFNYFLIIAGSLGMI
jgi:hypothetical protein